MALRANVNLVWEMGMPFDGIDDLDECTSFIIFKEKDVHGCGLYGMDSEDNCLDELWFWFSQQQDTQQEAIDFATKNYGVNPDDWYEVADKPDWANLGDPRNKEFHFPKSFFLGQNIAILDEVTMRWDDEFRTHSRLFFQGEISIKEFCDFVKKLNKEVIQVGKTAKWPDDIIEHDKQLHGTDRPDWSTPTYRSLADIACLMEAYFVRGNKRFAKDPDFYEFIKSILADDSYGGCRSLYFDLWVKTYRYDGIDIKKFLTDDQLGGATVQVLLRLKDGRWTKEVQELQRKHPDLKKKHVALYLERYPIAPSSEIKDVAHKGTKGTKKRN